MARATRLDQVAGYTTFAAVGLVALAAFGGLMWAGALNKSAGRTDNPAWVAAAASFGWAEYWVLLGLAAAAAGSLAVLALALNRIARQVERGVDPETRAWPTTS